MRSLLLLLFALTLLTPAAWAGTADAPELTDAAGDCAFATGNEYGDVVAAWVSDETATHFTVHLALEKWTLDALAEFTGYTVQFEHQGVQFGVAATYAMGAWEYANGYIDLESGDSSGFTPSTGSFAPGSPAILSVQFDKGHFPHDDPTDNALRSFQAGTADFKWYVPFGMAGQDAPVQAPFFGCDGATGTGTYEFQTGGHANHGAAGDESTADADAAANANATADSGTGGAPAESVEPASESSQTPGPGALVAAAAAAGAALLARRRRVS